MGLIVTLIVFVALAAIIVWIADGAPAHDDTLRVLFSIVALPVARLTEPNTKRNAN
jgi:hypothetical protein